MAVSVNMPGMPKESPAEGILKLVSVVSDLKRSSQQSDLYKAETEKNELANAEIKRTNDLAVQKLAKLQDPNSSESQLVRAQGSAYLTGLKNTGLFKNNDQTLMNLQSKISDPSTPGIQVSDIFEKSPVMKSITGLGEAQAKAQGMMPIAVARMAGVENQKDRIAASAADHFDKDPILTKINKQKQQIELDKHTLNDPNAVLTPQLVNEIQQGIANAISGGGSAGLGKTEQVEMHTASQKLAELQQKFTSDPTPVNNPALINYFRGTLDRLGGAYDANAHARAQQIFKGRSKGYASNPNAIAVMQEKVDSYQPQESPATQGIPAPGGHMTVIQKGHTFTWNSMTGKYE